MHIKSEVTTFIHVMAGSKATVPWFQAKCRTEVNPS